ncbi:hypothetical protein FSARC_5938 [Fusarium sarcochroum]|uniref:Uncharacterized protein n=1 Tax=Fusarium sarcochroum TaxID=1208366 RepID=A0A8H4TYM8_9HYPO|nr:hypothetical protein FSARC_5938 [Fusarium sarcochroum]
MASANNNQEFEGDEFSNNLFSDLAPLLTLFGEQVTKQFLSMSMGWADNVLLSMGPLGIMTIIVSAIRIGGDKKMKALVGRKRARESYSVAEQELLSSTSENVCEMWSGQQIVRLIGDSEELKTLIANQDGDIYNIQSAVKAHLLTLDGNYGSRLIYLVGGDVLESLSNAAPNLALNVSNATVPVHELWSLAALGTLLQLFAVAFSAVATYHWKWTKGGSPVQAYGYPCFCVGTLCLIVGVMVCGHIIEGVTEESEFHVSGTGREERVKIFRFQRARTVGDQHFPSCAIFNAEGNETIKISRLTSKNYRLMATGFAALAVTGYIAQFVGLRALHWSATIVQLGVTLIMTGFRAWVRRGLAEDPDVRPGFENHELAWLTLFLMSQKQQDGHPSNISAPTSQQTHNEQESQYFWELVTGYQKPDDLLFSRESHHLSEEKSPVFVVKQLFGPICGHLSVNLREETRIHPYLSPSEKQPALENFRSAGNFIPADDLQREVSTVSNALQGIIEKVMDFLSQPGAVSWKIPNIVPDKIGQDGELIVREHAPEVYLNWSFNVRSGKLPEYRSPDGLRTSLQFQLVRKSQVLRLPSDSALPPWELEDARYLDAVISLSMYAMAARLQFTNPLTPEESMQLESVSRPRRTLHAWQTRTGRIMGCTSRDSAREKIGQLRAWLNRPNLKIKEGPLPNGSGGTYFLRVDWYFGMFLSSLSSHDEQLVAAEQGARVEILELAIEEKPTSSLPIKWAQELLSLFMLAIASEIEEVLGPTEGHMDPPTKENACLRRIASLVVEGGLAETKEDAYVLIIPAFLKYDLLRD